MAIADLIARYDRGERSKELELALINYLDTPKRILEQLAGSRDREIAEAANLHVNLAGEITEGWYELAENIISKKDLGQNDLLIYELLEFAPVPDYFINEWMPWKQIAKGIENPYMPVLWRDRLLSRLVDLNNAYVRMWVAAYEHTPVYILKRLAGDSDITVRTIVSLHPSFSSEWFEEIKQQINLAKNWNTSPSELANLAFSIWQWVRVSVAQNPYTPLETLIELAHECHYAIVNNPYTPLETLIELAQQPECHYAIADNPNTPTQVLNIVANQHNPLHLSYENKALAKNPNTPKTYLLKLAKNKSKQILEYLVKNPNLPDEISEELSSKGYDVKFLQKDNNKNLNLSLLENYKIKLEQYPEKFIDLDFFQWFHYPSTDITKSSVLKLAAKNNDLEIRKLALEYGYACPDEFFEILATDIDPDIRKKIASSNATNNLVREKLATDEDEGVRQAVASCQYTPKYIRDRLVNDHSEKVRQAVENNKYFLGEHESISYVDILKRVQDFSYSIKSFKITKNIDNSEKFQQKLLEQLGEDRSPETSEYRSQLAEAIDTPIYILEKLITSPEIKIRYRLAKRGDLRFDLSDKLWKELVVDPEKDNIYNKRSRQHNHNYIPVILAEELEALPFLIGNYADSSNYFSRLIALTHPLLPYYLFKKYVKSKFWLDRYALGQNPNISKNIRQILSQDANRIVRAAAKCNGYIPQSLSKIIIPKNKTDNQNLLATFTVLKKQLARDRLSNDWHSQAKDETILWEVDRKQDLSFANFMIYNRILTKISLDEFIREFQKQASRQYKGKELCSPLIEPPITSESIDRCQVLLQWLQNNCEILEAYQINFHKQENIFQIVIGKSKDGNWFGISSLIGYETDHLHNTYSKTQQTKKSELQTEKVNHSLIKSLEPILINLNPSVRFLVRALVIQEFGRGVVYEIEPSKNRLIEKLLYSANFIEEIEANVDRFFLLYMTNYKAYKVGYWFSGTSYYHETYIIGETPQGDWLILNTQIYSYP